MAVDLQPTTTWKTGTASRWPPRPAPDLPRPGQQRPSSHTAATPNNNAAALTGEGWAAPASSSGVRGDCLVAAAVVVGVRFGHSHNPQSTTHNHNPQPTTHTPRPGGGVTSLPPLRALRLPSAASAAPSAAGRGPTLSSSSNTSRSNSQFCPLWRSCSDSLNSSSPNASSLWWRRCDT